LVKYELLGPPLLCASVNYMSHIR